MPAAFTRDRLTWLAYLLLAWFAYLQAAPGLVIPHLRDELDIGYTVGGLHVAAFAAGALASGLVSSWVEQAVGRRRLLWSSAALMGLGAAGLTAGPVVAATLLAVLVMGLGGGMLLATIQATLADHHGDLRTVALTEANVAASLAYVVLVGAFWLVAVLGAGWRAALLASLVVPLVAWAANRGLAIDAPAPPAEGHGRLPALFWVAAGVLVCCTAAEWCITAWGASFVDEAVDVSADDAVTLMVGYFGGVLVGRVVGSRLARRHDPALLLGVALVVAAVGFVVLWPSGVPVQAVAGLALLGLGVGNLFPMALSLAVSLAPEQAARASGRAVAVTSLAVMLSPLLVGSLADATSLHAALAVVPVTLALAAAGLLVVRQGRRARVSTPV
ncbi:MFS transporter [Nocardioides taihuensis]|uniref:MFS transporter n=1 Tax=Nocardioides taihuensis TaxID=1835606 RepID=A0ABW0BDH8_9ACTN